MSKQATADSSAVIRQGTLPNREIDSLVAAVRAGEPWRQALERLELPELSRKRHWFTDPRKAQFYLGLKPAGNREAVDIGSGSGVIAAGLAGAFKQVTALEQDAVWCDFMRLRYQQDGLGNVDVVEKGALPLPFADGRFDLVVVNGVLEWIPEAEPRGTPRDVQLNFLRDIRSKLAPGGALGIAIENRWYIEHFRGLTPHGEPPYCPVLPRGMAVNRCRRLTGRDYRTWIYGEQDYYRLLRDAGFGQVEVKIVLPTYHEPAEVIGFDNVAKLRAYFPSSNALRSAVLGLFGATGKLGQLVHSFYISARV